MSSQWRGRKTTASKEQIKLSKENYKDDYGNMLL